MNLSTVRKEATFKQSSEMLDNISDPEGNLYKKNKKYLEALVINLKCKRTEEDTQKVMDSVKSVKEKWRNMESTADDVTEYLETYWIKNVEFNKNKYV